MYELRFALIGLSVILLAGLTWWEMRRGRATRDYRDSRPADRQEPRMDALEGEGVSGDLPFIDDEEPIIATRQAPELRDDPGAPPPVVTIDDLPEDVDEVELADYADAAHRPLLHRYDDEPPRHASHAPPEPPVAPAPAPEPPPPSEPAPRSRPVEPVAATPPDE